MQLVQKFYQPGSPTEKARIDRCLKAVQRSHEAFGVADALLESQHEAVRFFGALTYTVKTNRDW